MTTSRKKNPSSNPNSKKQSAKRKRKAPKSETKLYIPMPKMVKRIAKEGIKFKKLRDCHDYSTCHKIYFRKMGCFRDYHELPEGCLGFDIWVEKVSTSDYKKEFFTYYKIISEERLLSPEYYTQNIVTDTVVQNRLERCVIMRKDWNSVPKPRDPKERQAFERLFKRVWPPVFDYNSPKQRGSVRTMESLRNSIETCITYRLWFREECVRQCSPLVDTFGHDQFLLILQILLAKIVVNKLDQK